MANFPLTDTLIVFTRTLSLFKVTCHELHYLNRLMFCDTRYLLYWIATKVLCFCLISSIVLMCGFYFNMASGSDCAVSLGRSCLTRLITKSVYTGVSEWVSEWHIYISESPQQTRFNASCLDEFKNCKKYHNFENPYGNFPHYMAEKTYFLMFSCHFCPLESFSAVN